MKRLKKETVCNSESVGPTTSRQLTVYLVTPCRFRDANDETDCYFEEDLYINAKLPRREQMACAASGIAYIWMNWLHRQGDKRYQWHARPSVRVGTRRYHLKLTRRSIERGFTVDPCGCRITIEYGTRAEIVSRAIRATQEAWRNWRDDALHDLIYRPRNEHEALPASERDDLMIDFQVAMQRIARESAETEASER